MAGGAVAAAPAASPPNWKLADPINGRTQGLVASGFKTLPFGRALLLEFDWAIGTAGGAWLRTLTERVDITHGAPEEPTSRAASLAFTWTGLQRMGLEEQALASFSRPFREGMFQEDRSRRLGDRRNGAWCKTVIYGGPRWSAKTPVRDPTVAAAANVTGYSVPHPKPDEAGSGTDITVHALLLLYTEDEGDAHQWAAEVEDLLATAGVRVVHHLDLLLDVEKQGGVSREHFGFADGLSQPVPYGLGVPNDETKLVLINGAPAAQDPVQGVPLGEILFGYQNGHSEPAPGPVVQRQIDGDPTKEDKRPGQAGLPDHPQAEGFADLGIDGSYLVVRELRQDVAAFWTTLDTQAARIRAADPEAAHVDAVWLAERIIGRGVDGHLLCPGSYLPADQYGCPDNGFRFSASDPQGRGCPPGSHVRRAFPRDALAPQPTEESRKELLQAANNHRILRRGRKFGHKIAADRQPDGADRGLLFMCLNTDIERQFEFVQQTWLLNSSFATLFNEVDPLLGPAGKQTIRDGPLRRMIDVDTYVQLAGGDYFFLPSMRAISYLSLL